MKLKSQQRRCDPSDTIMNNVTVKINTEYVKWKLAKALLFTSASLFILIALSILHSEFIYVYMFFIFILLIVAKSHWFRLSSTSLNEDLISLQLIDDCICVSSEKEQHLEKKIRIQEIEKIFREGNLYLSIIPVKKSFSKSLIRINISYFKIEDIDYFISEVEKQLHNGVRPR